MLVFLKNVSFMEFKVRHLTLFPLFSIIDGYNDLPDDVICNIALYANDTTLYSKVSAGI